ncbi:MAG: DoxX family protein [Rhodospirillaceae bacterium]|nr:MAG: DoxX family protein [Rhodospirillaceae bacterium]
MEGLRNIAALIGRILIAVIFLWSGFGKVTNFGGTVGYISSVGLPMPEVAAIIAVIVELIGGLCLLIGFQARLAGLAIAIFTVAAGFSFHTNFGDMTQTIMFFKNLAIAGGALQIFAFGAGAFSIDKSR